MCFYFLVDDSDDVEEESEGESNSGEDDGEEEEEEEEANEDDDDDDDDDGIIAMVYLGCQIFRHRSFLQPTTQFLSDEEEDAKAEDETFGRTAGDLAGMSSDEDSDKCPICLNSFISQLVATPENCEHYFCLDCILEWTKVGAPYVFFFKVENFIMFNSIIVYLSIYKNATSFMVDENDLFLVFVLCLECKLLSYRPHNLQQHLSEKIVWRKSGENGECDNIFTGTFTCVCV